MNRIELQIVAACERMLRCHVESIEPTTTPSIKKISLTAFVLVCVPGNCRCNPQCRREIIALQKGVACAFVGPEDYSQLEEMALAVDRESKS